MRWGHIIIGEPTSCKRIKFGFDLFINPIAFKLISCIILADTLTYTTMALLELSSLNTENLNRLSIGSRRSGRPRMDRTERLLHRFYEPLVLLRVLDPTRGVQNTNRGPDSTFDTLQDLRRKFLDQLSWTCDYKHGGDTVSAIAAEETPQGTRFWLAANSN